MFNKDDFKRANGWCELVIYLLKITNFDFKE